MTIDIGTATQLFVDDLIVDEIHGVTSTLHQPAKYAGNPIMTPLYHSPSTAPSGGTRRPAVSVPWEGRLTLYGTVEERGDRPFPHVVPRVRRHGHPAHGR